MVKRTVVLGRSANNNEVDFDLSMEAPAFKISRRQVKELHAVSVCTVTTYWHSCQAIIQLTDNGEFILHNEGRRAMFVSGKAVVSKTFTKLLHNQVLEVNPKIYSGTSQ